MNIINVAQCRILSPDGKVLVLRRAENQKNNPGKWTYPGGKFEVFDGNLRQTAIRETIEETGLKVVICGLYDFFDFAAKEPDTEIHCEIYIAILDCPSESYVKLSNEHDQYEWVSFEECKKRGVR